MLIKELKKIKKLKTVKVLIFLNVLLLFIFILKEYNKTNFFDFYFNVSLDLYNVVLFFNILIYIIIGEILSDEYIKGTLDYQVIKYGSIIKVIANKLLSAYIFVLTILIFDMFVIFCFGYFTKVLEAYQIFDSRGSVILNDNIVFNSWLRMFLYNIDLLVGMAITTKLSGLMATFSNNKISAIIGSFIGLMLLTYPIQIGRASCRERV